MWEVVFDFVVYEKLVFCVCMYIVFEVWCELCIYFIGVVMFGMLFVEGGVNDWIVFGIE